MMLAFLLLCTLFGDGVHDDTAAIQELLDSGSSLVELPAPKVEYRISRTLLLGDGQELRLGRFTRVRLADGSDCSMLANRDFVRGNRHVAVSGGIWDMNNRGQRHNLAALFWMEKEKRRMWLNEKREYVQEHAPSMKDRHDSAYFLGACFRFFNVGDFVLRGVTIRNPTTYGIQLWKVRDFRVDDVEFDYAWGNPAKANMDGLHLDGFCVRGKITNMRGCCFDDFVALNATDGTDSPGHGPISDIDIDGVYCDYCHSAVRLLSRSPADAIRRIAIRNVHGRYYSYGIGLTYFLPEIRERGVMDAITISDCRLSKAGEPADCWQFAAFGIVEIEKGLDIGELNVERLVRDEDHRPEIDTIRLREGATVDRLVLRDCVQVNRTADPMTFLHNRGKIGTLVNEGTRLVSAPGTNVEIDERTFIPQWDPPWRTLDGIRALKAAEGYPERGAAYPYGKVRAGFGEKMIRVHPFVGDVATAGNLRIDDYSAAGFPGYFAVEFPEPDIRAEATVSETAGWFRIRYPEYVERKLLASKNLNLVFSEPLVGTETVGENVVYRFAPGWEPIVVKASESEVTDEGFDFDKTMSKVRKAWNGVLK